ncbi:hypothetical protein, partial [Neokomagataea anthophila]
FNYVKNTLISISKRFNFFLKYLWGGGVCFFEICFVVFLFLIKKKKKNKINILKKKKKNKKINKKCE